jgi:hypothetical protein
MASKATNMLTWPVKTSLSMGCRVMSQAAVIRMSLCSIRDSGSRCQAMAAHISPSRAAVFSTVKISQHREDQPGDLEGEKRERIEKYGRAWRIDEVLLFDRSLSLIQVGGPFGCALSGDVVVILEVVDVDDLEVASME